MKAFVLYPKNQRDLNILMDNLKKYGYWNCDFETFNRIFIEWHLKSFPGCPVDISTVNFRTEWLNDFVNYISNYELKEVEK